MTQAAEKLKVESAASDGGFETRRVRCSSCNYTLLEVMIETPADSRVWLKTKCKGCKAYNVAVFRDGRLNVSTVQ